MSKNKDLVSVIEGMLNETLTEHEHNAHNKVAHDVITSKPKPHEDSPDAQGVVGGKDGGLSQEFKVDQRPKGQHASDAGDNSKEIGIGAADGRTLDAGGDKDVGKQRDGKTAMPSGASPKAEADYEGKAKPVSFREDEEMEESQDLENDKDADGVDDTYKGKNADEVEEAKYEKLKLEKDCDEDDVDEACGSMKEKLYGDQHKLDHDKDGDIDAGDMEKVRRHGAVKEAEGEELKKVSGEANREQRPDAEKGDNAPKTEKETFGSEHKPHDQGSDPVSTSQKVHKCCSEMSFDEKLEAMSEGDEDLVLAAFDSLTEEEFDLFDSLTEEGIDEATAGYANYTPRAKKSSITNKIEKDRTHDTHTRVPQGNGNRLVPKDTNKSVDKKSEIMTQNGGKPVFKDTTASKVPKVNPHIKDQLAKRKEIEAGGGKRKTTDGHDIDAGKKKTNAAHADMVGNAGKQKFDKASRLDKIKNAVKKVAKEDFEHVVEEEAEIINFISEEDFGLLECIAYDTLSEDDADDKIAKMLSKYDSRKKQSKADRLQQQAKQAASLKKNTGKDVTKLKAGQRSSGFNTLDDKRRFGVTAKEEALPEGYMEVNFDLSEDGNDKGSIHVIGRKKKNFHGQKINKPEHSGTIMPNVRHDHIKYSGDHTTSKKHGDPASHHGMTLHIHDGKDDKSWYSGKIVGHKMMTNRKVKYTIDTSGGHKPSHWKGSDTHPRAHYSMHKPEAQKESYDGLEENFKEKAAIIFETTVNEKVMSIQEQMEQDFERQLQEEKEALNARVEELVAEATQEWIAENQLEIKYSLRTEISENFIRGLKGLFAENYIEIPDEEVSVVDELTETVESYKEQLEEQQAKLDEANAIILENTKQGAFEEIAEGLTETQKIKLEKLSEAVVAEDIEEFEYKLTQLKDSYFTGLAEQIVPMADEIIEEQVMQIDESSPVSHYASFLSKTIR